VTVERVVAVVAPLDEFGRRLAADIHSAEARAQGAEPGERLDIVRYEALSSQMEGWAFRQIARDALVIELDSVAPCEPTLVFDRAPMPAYLPDSSRTAIEGALASGSALVVVVLPLEAGMATQPSDPVAAPPAAERWEDPEGRSGKGAVEARFRSQLERATRGDGGREPISPTGIANKVLTENLRAFVARGGAAQPVEARVEYRDGSRAANPFVLRSLDLADAAGAPTESYSFALLSIRHTELDAIVDGAWLRNMQISQTRTQADTDDLVYSISRKQITALTQDETVAVEIRMYQTGLEPAIVGFYRAVVDHLREHPGSLTVLPMYFQQPRPPLSEKDRSSRSRGRGKTRSGRSDSGGTSAPVPEQEEATYAPGLAWATRQRSRR